MLSIRGEGETGYVTKPTRSTQPCIPLGLLNWEPALISWGKSGNITSAGWKVVLCNLIWHVSSHNSEACSRTAIHSSLPRRLDGQKIGSAYENMAAESWKLYRVTSWKLHQCDTRPTLTFPATEHHWIILLVLKGRTYASGVNRDCLMCRRHAAAERPSPISRMCCTLHALYAAPLQKWPPATAICYYGAIAMLHVLCYVFARTFLLNPHFILNLTTS